MGFVAREWRSYPERIAQRHVLFAAGGLRHLRGAGAGPRGDGVHQSLSLASLELLRHLHQIGDVVAEIANLRQRVHRARRRLGAATLRLGERDAREEILLDLRAGFHAGKLALRKGARGVAVVAAELLGRLAEFLRELLRFRGGKGEGGRTVRQSAKNEAVEAVVILGTVREIRIETRWRWMSSS